MYGEFRSQSFFGVKGLMELNKTSFNGKSFLDKMCYPNLILTKAMLNIP